MNSKLNRTLGIALVAQLVLLVGVSFAKDEPKMAPPSKVFPDFVADKVTEIEISGDAATGGAPGAGAPTFKSVKLAKSGTSWGIASADGYPVDTTKVTTFLESVGKLKSGGAVVSKDSYYKKLEVADDDYQRKVTLTHDGKTVSFLVGSSPGFKRVHLRVAGEKDVRLVEGLSAWDVGYRASDWVDRAFVKIPEADVWGLTLDNSKGRVQLERSPSGEWAVLGAKPDQVVKKSAVDELVRKVAAINLEEPIGKADKPEHGFAAPQASVTLVVGTSSIAGTPPKTTTTQTVRIGGKAAEGNAYYVRASTSEYVVSAPGWSVEALNTKAVGELFEAPAGAAAPK
jgi:hypothetical protein